MLCNRFAEGAKESGNNVEKIFLASKNIGYCKGCGVCNNTHKCIQNDDMKEILDKMVNADVIVLATPVYFYSVSGQMKCFIDRTVPRYTEIKNKDFYFIFWFAIAITFKYSALLIFLPLLLLKTKNVWKIIRRNLWIKEKKPGNKKQMYRGF